MVRVLNLRHGVISITATLVVLCTGVLGGAIENPMDEIYTDIPQTVDPTRRYLFYMHGAWIEQHGLNRPHPHHGFYEYENIVNALADRGFVVISEARLTQVEPSQYVDNVAAQVRRLLAQGVSPEHITVIGHSKGGSMALLLASLLEEKRLNVVVMAGCGKPGTMFRRGYEKFLARHATHLHGRILSLYDEADQEAGTCQESFERAGDVESQEVVFQTGLGHGLFYAPRPTWIEQVARWAEEE